MPSTEPEAEPEAESVVESVVESVASACFVSLQLQPQDYPRLRAYNFCKLRLFGISCLC